MYYSSISAPPPPRFFLAKITAGLLFLLAFLILSTQVQAQTRPEPENRSIDVRTDATAANPYVFKTADFPFSGGATLQHVEIEALPANGTLRRGSVTDPTVPFNLSDIGTLAYWPESGQSVKSNYASFTFGIQAGGQRSLTTATLTINLVAPPQAPASGAPLVTAQISGSTVWNEDVALVAYATNIADPNGIDTSTYSWQWQIAAAPQSGTPADGDYAAISGVPAGVLFTPRQAHVGRYVRVCVSFTDMHPTPVRETVCTAGNLIANVNDAPEAADDTIIITPSATHTFSSANFSFDDDDMDSLASINIASLPATGSLTVGGTAATLGQSVAAASIGTIVYTPASNAADGSSDSFTFTVTDDGSDGSGDKTSESATINIFISTTPDAAVGMPAVAYTGQITVPTEDSAITASQGSVADPDNTPVTSLGTISWQWSQADSNGGTYTNIEGATDAAFTPGDDQVDKYLQVCASFTDSGGSNEQRCLQIGSAVANINDKPTTSGNSVSVSTAATAANPYRFQTADFPFDDADGDMLAGIIINRFAAATTGTLALDGTALSPDNTPTAAITPAQLDAGALTYYPEPGQQPTDSADPNARYYQFVFRVTDDGHDGNDASRTSALATISIRLVSLAQAAASGAPEVTPRPDPASGYAEDTELTASTRGIVEPNNIDNSTLMWQWQSSAASDGTFAAIADATDSTFAPGQAQVGQYIRVCVSFMDLHSTPADEGPLCSTSGRVTNINDAPMALDHSINVPVDATMASPYRFTIADFPFRDEDRDALASITLASVPTSGTLRNGSAAAAVGDSIDAEDIDDLVYWPDSGQNARTGYASFTFNITDYGSDGTGNMTSARAATLTINLATASPTAASGAPTVAAAIGNAYNQNVELGASTRGINEPNGIDESTVTWQWQQAATEDGAFADIAGASAATFTPGQGQVDMYIRACASFTDAVGTDEGPLCSAPGRIIDVNDPPMARPENTHNAMRADDGSIAIPVSAFMAAYSDPDGDDPLESVTITVPPPEAEGTLSRGDDQIMIDGTLNVLAITNGEFTNGPLTLTMEEGVQTTTLTFTLNDGEADSNPATLTITLGSDIEEEQVTQISAILSVAAVTNATTAIGGAISSVPTPTAFDISMDGTSLMGAAQKLGQSKTADSPHQAWYLGTAPQWEHNAAWNASDSSRASLLNHLQSMANGDIALNYSITDTSTMRFWARYQSLDLSGNEGESLEYDGSGTGFYLGADNQITDKMRIGLAIGTDSSDISIDLDDDKTNAKDEATRSATSFYPYLHIDLGNNNNARVIAGFGSGTLDIKSTANSNSTASADLSWNMLAASISHHRQMKGNLSARFDGSLQLGNTSVDETTFSSGSTLMAADSSASELSINAELRYQSNNITPFASLAARKLGGDLSQSMALDMAFGADLQTNPANLRFAITRQINDTTHQRHSISLDASTRPSASGISASLGSRYDSITGRPQWQSTIGWQRPRHSISLAASPGDYRLQARLRW